MKKYITKIAIGLSLFTFFGCSDFLEEEVYTQYDPNSFLQDQGGVDALLTGVYAQTQTSGFAARNYYQILNEFNTDISFESDGGLERSVLPIQRFELNPSIQYIDNEYSKYYTAISRANSVLNVTVDLENVELETIEAINAEARFLRAYSYYILHGLFGPTPIIEIPVGASLDEIERIGKETPRATEEEYRDYVEADLLFAAQKLESGAIASKANRGSAYALLVKFYLNNKEWEKAVDASNQVLSMGYELYNDYPKMFSVNGKNNKEYIFMTECLVGSNQTNFYMAHAFPPEYVRQSNWGYYGAQYRVYTDFYESFEESDTRREPFLAKYTNPNNGNVTLYNRDEVGNALNNVRSFKYEPDPDALGVGHGNDIPIIRLADIILSKAEALNEINGPTQTSLDLINQIRERAALEPAKLSDYATKEGLNDLILSERAKEFYDEGLRREDLIRHGKFISKAIERGYAAKPFHTLYPIPQAQIDNNPNLDQNPGYN
ncbi:RagB/SusD family nutrient uptake outer membrane protein [Joostella sp.]|uniref:RagB/SusD family nutrient uptake outer membrane protein n=1 Tax=Joostella sp. TaxID=2231138 RepID=UPI003A918479